MIEENPKEGMELMQAWSDAIGGKAPANEPEYIDVLPTLPDADGSGDARTVRVRGRCSFAVLEELSHADEVVFVRGPVAGCVLVGGLVSGCKEKPVEKENTEKIDLWENAAKILADVKDKKGLEEAKPKLMEIADKLRKMDEEEQERKKNHATRPVVSKEQKARLDEVTNRKFGPEYSRLSQVEGCKFNPRRVPGEMQRVTEVTPGTAAHAA